METNNPSNLDDNDGYTSEGELKHLNSDMLRGKETPQHAMAKREKAVELVNRGYTVWFEQRYMDYVIDIYAERGDDVLLIEVGKTTRDKIDKLSSIDEVTIENIPYHRDGNEIVGISESNKPDTSSIRPTIPASLVMRMKTPLNEQDVCEDQDLAYELAGVISKGEFVREAVREKLDRVEDEHDLNPYHHLAEC